MAITKDVVSSGTPGTGDISWSHGGGTPKGVIVFITATATTADQILGVTYGGVSMTEVTGSPLVYSTGETHVMYAYFLGASVPSGTQTVAVDADGAGATKTAVCYTINGAADLELQDVDVSINTVASSARVTLSLGSVNCFVTLSGYSGRGVVTDVSPQTGWTSDYEYSFGAASSIAYSYDTIGSTDVSAGFDNSVGDEQSVIAVAIKEAAGGGAQTLTPSLYTNSSTFHTPTVSAGAVTLTPALFSNSQTFHAATVSQTGAAQDLTPSLFSNSATFYTHTAAVGAVTLLPSLVVNSQTFHQPAVSVGAVTLLPSLVSNSQTFHSATVSIEGGPQYLVPDLVANSNTFHAATVSTGAVTLTPALFANAQTFHSATVSQAGLTLEPSLVVNTHQFFTAIVTTGGVTLTPGLFTNSATFYVAAVTGGIQTTLGAARSSGRQIQTTARTNIQTNRR